MKADSNTIDGLIFTANGHLSAAETAAAFANLSAGATQGNSTLGSYSGAIQTWISGAVTGTATVLFSSTVAGPVADLSTLTTSIGATLPTATTVQGVAAVAAVVGQIGVYNPLVGVYDVNNSSNKAGTITTVNLSNFTEATIGDNALTTLNVTNGIGNITIVNGGLTTATNKTLALNINGQGHGLNSVGHGVLADDGIYTTLNVTTSGVKSTLDDITFGALTTLTVAGDKALTLVSAAGMTKLATVTVSGSAGLTADLSLLTTVTSVNASATSGDNTITLDATKATYTGGKGVDNVTTSVAVPTKAISLGAGNDSLTLASGTVSSTGLLDGGAGTDTLVMNAADAEAVIPSFQNKISNFEKLRLTDGTTNVVDLASLDDISYVSTAGNALLTLGNMANAGTLEITGDTTAVTVVMTDATGVADSFNVALASAATIAAGTVTVAGVETIAITSNDTDALANTGNNLLTVVAAAAKTITVSGNAGLDLTSANTTVTSVDASAMKAAFIYTTATTAQTVTGGSGDDLLIANTGTAVAQTLIGGAGDDTLVTNGGLTQLTGGLGADTFVIQTAGANVSIYATTDAKIGDTIQFTSQGLETFNTTKLIQGVDATLQSYADEAASGNGLANAALSWFQFHGNTFVVEDLSSEATFQNGTDLIVELTGLVDLSHTSINTDFASLLIA